LQPFLLYPIMMSSPRTPTTRTTRSQSATYRGTPDTVQVQIDTESPVATRSSPRFRFPQTPTGKTPAALHKTAALNHQQSKLRITKTITSSSSIPDNPRNIDSNNKKRKSLSDEVDERPYEGTPKRPYRRFRDAEEDWEDLLDEGLPVENTPTRQSHRRAPRTPLKRKVVIAIKDAPERNGNNSQVWEYFKTGLVENRKCRCKVSGNYLKVCVYSI